MVPPPPAADADADPAWLDRIRNILSLNEGGVVIGLEGAHRACAGPLVETLLKDGGAVEVCFDARELLEAPEDARVILLNAARDAEFLNFVRPVVSEHRLRVLVWLQPGDRRELSRRARDFLDWMQESVDVPQFLPMYASNALRRVFEDGGQITWEGAPLRDLGPEVTMLHPDHIDDREGVESMRSGPVVVHRARSMEEVERFEAMHRAAGRTFGIIWDDPAVPPTEAERIIAEPLDWELASSLLSDAGLDDPNIEAAKLHLDPIAVSRRAGRPPPDPLGSVDVLTRGLSLPRDEAPLAELTPAPPPHSTDPWWMKLARACDLSSVDDPDLVVPRPDEAPGFEWLAHDVRGGSEPRIHAVTGPVGSGVSTELRSLSRRLHESCCVVMLDVGDHGFTRLEAWELIVLLGIATVRVGRDRWDVRWSHELVAMDESISRVIGENVDVEQLASNLVGVRAPDRSMPSRGHWNLPLGTNTSTRGGEFDEADEIETQTLTDELAAVLYDADFARMVVARAGFPQSRIPPFRTPMTFWHNVVEQARAGLLRGGVQPIIDEAAQMYPGNESFARFRSSAPARPRHHALATAVRLAAKQIEITTDLPVVFVVDGLQRLPSVSDIDNLLGSPLLRKLQTDLVIRIPSAMLSRPEPLAPHDTFTRLDDIPVVDVHDPTKYGPGLAFFRNLLDTRLRSENIPRDILPKDITDRLGWASGGRPREFLSLLRELAQRASSDLPERLHEASTSVLRDHRDQLARGLSREDHEYLESLLSRFESELPQGRIARELYATGALRLFPTPEGGHRVRPHPVLIDDLLRS